jgi:hypothetical protein
MVVAVALEIGNPPCRCVARKIDVLVAASMEIALQIQLGSLTEFDLEAMEDKLFDDVSSFYREISDVQRTFLGQ